MGRVSPRSAIGARVTLTTTEGTQIGLVKGGGSYLSTSNRTLLFGLGSADVVKSLVVSWPSGKTTELTGVKTRQRLTLIEAGDSP